MMVFIEMMLIILTASYEVMNETIHTLLFLGKMLLEVFFITYTLRLIINDVKRRISKRRKEILESF